jgi:hypothetical protein
MQTTIYYNNEDAYLIGQVDAKGRRERKSRSAVLLSILVDIGVISHANLCKGLDLQKSKFADKLLGDILLEEELVSPEAVERALLIQDRQREEVGNG